MEGKNFFSTFQGFGNTAWDAWKNIEASVDESLEVNKKPVVNNETSSESSHTKKKVIESKPKSSNDEPQKVVVDVVPKVEEEEEEFSLEFLIIRTL